MRSTGTFSVDTAGYAETPKKTLMTVGVRFFTGLMLLPMLYQQYQNVVTAMTLQRLQVK